MSMVGIPIVTVNHENYYLPTIRKGSKKEQTIWYEFFKIVGCRKGNPEVDPEGGWH
jgi:hypothetical protein